MDKVLDEALCARWPMIFRDRHGDPARTAMNRGFECGDGWFWLIDQACAALQAQAEHHDAPQPVATQVKEKFGTLRFRLAESNAAQRAILDFLFGLSSVTCEECGRMGMDCAHAAERLTQVRACGWDSRFRPLDTA